MPQLVYPPEPAYQRPAAPKGLSGAFAGKKRHEEAVSLARASHEIARRSWHERYTRMHTDDVAEAERQQQAERDRVGKLAAEATYQEECRQRDADAEARNQELS
jgi:restriction system protein